MEKEYKKKRSLVEKIYNLFKDKYKFTKNIHIIQTGIETSKFYKENFNQKDINSLKKKLGIKKKDFVVMTVSRLAKEKRVDRIINNHKELVKKYSNMKQKVLVYQIVLFLQEKFH